MSVLSEWFGLFTGRCLKEARKSMHDSNKFHRQEISSLLKQATQNRERQEEELERLERAVSIKELTGTEGDD